MKYVEKFNKDKKKIKRVKKNVGMDNSNFKNKKRIVE